MTVMSRRIISGAIRTPAAADITTVPGTLACNELDTHADTCCGGPNWSVMEISNEICEVTPFLDTYESVKAVPVVRMSTVWSDPDSSEDYLLVMDQCLWFGQLLKHSLINPNQIRDYGHPVHDDPYRHEVFGIETDKAFIPFDTTGTIVHFTSRVPTDWEQKHLPVIILTGEEWDPLKIEMRQRGSTREDNDMKQIRSLTSGLRKSEVSSIYAEGMNSQAIRFGESDTVLSNISTTYNEQEMTHRLIGAVNIACADRRDVDSVMSNDRHSKITAEELARTWNIGLQTAKDTMKATTQRGVRTSTRPMNKRVRVDHLDLHVRRMPGTWYCDTVLARVKSLLGNICANVFTNGRFTKVVPMKSRKEAGFSFQEFVNDVGAPELLVTDGASEFTGNNTEFKKHVRRMRVKHWISEQGRSNQNHAAEREIGYISQCWKLRMAKRNVPKRLWDFGFVYEAELVSRMARGRNRRTGYEEVTGQTPEIGEYLDFGFYDTVWWWDRPGKPDSTDDPRRLAKWLGISHNVGSDMCYWLVTDSGKIVSKTSVERVVREDLLSEDSCKRIKDFEALIAERLKDENFDLNQDDLIPGDLFLEDIELSEDNAGVRYGEAPPDEDYGDMLLEPRPDDEDVEENFDNYIGVELIMDVGTDGERRGRVVKRARDNDGRPIGRKHDNATFDSREYYVELTDGTREKYTANIIAENMMAQIDDEGQSYAIMREITDHRKDATAVPISDGTIRSRTGNERLKTTTRGWQLLVEWKDGGSDWIDLKDIKASNPLEVAEYAVANRLVEEPAFKWWVPHVLRKRNRIISKVKSKYWKQTHKFGIRLPHSVEEALRIDEETRTTFWRDAINKEMSKAKIAWKAKDGATPDDVRAGKLSDMIGFQEIGCHVVFDVKMDFERKARFCANGNETRAPSSITYSSVVSRDSIRLAFLIADLNGLDLLACDLANAFLNAPCAEKIWFEGGTECGEDKGKVCILVRALYGLKSAGFSWRSALAATLRDLGFTETKADPNVWIRPDTKDDGTEYYEMLFVYVDDVLALSKNPRSIIDAINEVYKVKQGSDKKPDRYLGGDVMEVEVDGGRRIWATSPRTYVKNSIRVVEDLLNEDGEGYVLKRNCKNPLPQGYRPELDISPELGPRLISRFQQLIGIL
ncbi:reverse transcriptase RNA-dependent DNA polymerase [Nitzschia inconspicua]|uniref:Reverse transcriptase RNA-dependent DNA polymerase n=1 Tax=Nitzschia inconspicua TaxID=303405 RepID=A0A9K3Q4C3_9STRA|nr:reverse transcriptase RNA-dependent DNA polymerase [Nitzschia inconspicua]